MKKILDYNILELGTYSLKVYNVIAFLLFLLIVIILLVLIRRIVYKSKSLDAAKKFSVVKLSRYTIAVIAVLMGLRILGFDISVFLAGSAAILVGIGFGLQNLFNDFISGIILLLDRTLKVGDVVEVNNMICLVQEINFRTTTVLNRDESYVILPNSELTKNRVVNWTYNNVYSRFEIRIGVDYSTDVALLIQILKEAALGHPQVLKNPEPFVRFEDYGDSALLFSLYFHTNEIFRVETTKSQIRIELFKALKQYGINIPFPHRVVHLKK